MTYYKQRISLDQAKDTGLAVLLIILLVTYFRNQPKLILPAIGVLILTMASPAIFRPFAHIWFGFSHLLGTVVSRCLLTVIFFVLVTPVGVIRRRMGRDPMLLKAWKVSRGSVFVERDHIFHGTDLERPY